MKKLRNFLKFVIKIWKLLLKWMINLKDKSMDDILVKKFFSKMKTVIQKISERIKSGICLLSL